MEKWIILAVVIYVIGIIIATMIMRGAFKQRKPCACVDCKYQGTDGFCFHRCPCVDSNKQCSSYEKYNRTY